MGAPAGNRNGEKGKRFRLALDAEIERRGGQKAIQKIVGAMMDEAEKGEQWACKEFFDRLAGKPTQAIEADISGSIGLIDILRNASDTKSSD